MRARCLEQNNLRSLGHPEWLAQGKGVGTSMALGSGLAEGAGWNAGVGAGIAVDTMAGRYDQKHDIRNDANRARIGHNGIPGAIMSI